MTVLHCHNRYRLRGGEDESFEAEAAQLEARGDRVVRFTMDSASIDPGRAYTVACRGLWNHTVYRELRAVIRRERPALMHCQNTFPLISASAYYAARAEGIPVVQSVRNFRLWCANALLFRGSRVCDACIGTWPWRGVWHRCYRDSRSASFAVAMIAAVQRFARACTQAVDLYITPSEFARSTCVRAGLPASRVAVKPNCLPADPQAGRGGRQAVFAGRLSPEKGIVVLLDAWARLDEPIPLTIAGDGPMRDLVQRACARDGRIVWAGRLPHPQVLSLMSHAACTLVPSISYETFGRTVVESYAVGTPVVASRLGALPELVDDGRTGLLTEPGDAQSLAAAVRRLTSLSHADTARFRGSARREFESKYTGSANYTQLTQLYRRVLASARRDAAVLERAS